jgi:hypothetical protein
MPMYDRSTGVSNRPMKIKTIAVILSVAFVSGLPIFGKDKPGKAGKTEAPAPKLEANAKAAVENGSKEPWANVDVRIGAPEKQVIREYVNNCETPHKGKKSKGLPPGLAKKVAHGGDLPPGWQKKCVRGEILSEELYKQSHSLPQGLIVKLPPPPVGTITVAISGKIVRLAKATREILDVFDVH